MKIIRIITFLVLGFWFLVFGVLAEEEAVPSAQSVPQAEPATPQAPAEEQTAIVDTLTASQNVTLDFKDADIRNVLKIISYKAAVNIVTTPEVMGNVTVRLVDVPWENALDVILKTYGFGYEKKGNIITVAPIDKLTAMKKQEVELAQVQPTATEVFTLKYIDAQDAKKAIEPQLSPRGKITILEMTGQGGWEFGTKELAKRKRITEERMSRSKVLIVSDVPPVLDKIKEVIEKIDIKPKQILIETRLVEVNRDKLKDIGIDWATGVTGVSGDAYSISPLDKSKAGATKLGLGVHSGTDEADVTPSVFGPKATNLTTSAGLFRGGIELVFRKFSGAQFEAILHALEEDVTANTLSAPSIMTLNNQEATILVGTKYPILKSEVSSEAAGQTVSVSLEYYQDIGIQLNVVPQVSADNYINMIVHPAVSSSTASGGSITSAQYPIIDIREAETRVLMKDGETVVIGGLLKDVKSKSVIGIPILSKIPILGLLFRRDTIDTQKIDLLVFITARIVKENDFSPEEISKLEEKLDRGNKKAIKKKDN